MKKLIALTLSLLLLAGCAAPAVYDGPTESAWVLTESRTTYYNAVTGESQTMGRNHSYDGFGNEIRTRFYSDGELTDEVKRIYDDRGNCIREVQWEQFWIFSYPISRTDYTYDDQNRPLTVTYRNGFGFKTGGSTYTYDDEANTITWNGTYDTQIKYLNENGDPIRVVTYSHPAGMEIETLYEYDEQGRKTKTLEYRDGILRTTTQTRYDDQGRILEDIWYDTDGTILLSNTYLYDGNTVITLDEQGNKGVKTLRPDGQVETQENYGPDGKLLGRTENIYTQIQVPVKEE